MNINIAQMSDLHYCEEYLEEADRCFNFAVDEAIRRNVQVAIISGDSTHHQLDAHSPVFNLLARRLKKLADHCPVFMLQGTFSHEPPGLLRMFAMIKAKYPIVISEQIEMIGLSDGKWVEYDPVASDQPSYQLVITSVPTVNKADLVMSVGAENASVEMGNHLASILGSFYQVNGKLREQGVPTVLVSHGTVDGSMNESGVPMAGLDHEFSMGALYAANADVVMLGHIHKQQSWERVFQGIKQIIAYPGSIGRFHYGEIDEKYFLDWIVDTDGSSYEAVVTPSRRMIDIDFDGVPNLEELAAVAKDCAGAFVRVRYNVDEEHAGTIDRNAIKQILGGSIEVKIVPTVLMVQRQRCPGISTLQTIEERFVKWCEHTNTPQDGLLERLSMLQTMDPADIARNFARRNKRKAVGMAIDQFHVKPVAVESFDDVFA